MGIVTTKAKKARMKRDGKGSRSASDGWYVVNARDAVWYENEKFGASTPFEGEPRFAQYGINIHVLMPGQPNCHYHAESDQEDFLVLEGECILIVDGKEVPLSKWDFVHCAPWTDHVFVGAGSGPCALLMVGARSKRGKIRYPVSKVAGKYGASAAAATPHPRESYAGCPPWKVASRRPAPFA
jgi:mannose-6-phosphate isomerase-like protein (cupin superfamily)